MGFRHAERDKGIRMAMNHCNYILTPFINGSVNESLQIQHMIAMTNSIAVQVMSHDVTGPDRRRRTVSCQPEEIRIVPTPHRHMSKPIHDAIFK